MKKLIFGSLLILSMATFTACGNENAQNQNDSENVSEDVDTVETDTSVETDTDSDEDSTSQDTPETDSLGNVDSTEINN